MIKDRKDRNNEYAKKVNESYAGLKFDYSG